MYSQPQHPWLTTASLGRTQAAVPRNPAPADPVRNDHLLSSTCRQGQVTISQSYPQLTRAHTHTHTRMHMHTHTHARTHAHTERPYQLLLQGERQTLDITTIASRWQTCTEQKSCSILRAHPSRQGLLVCLSHAVECRAQLVLLISTRV